MFRSGASMHELLSWNAPSELVGKLQSYSTRPLSDLSKLGGACFAASTHDDKRRDNSCRFVSSTPLKRGFTRLSNFTRLATAGSRSPPAQTTWRDGFAGRTGD